MRHRIKKKLNSSRLNKLLSNLHNKLNHLLHSDKGTYFYNSKLSKLFRLGQSDRTKLSYIPLTLSSLALFLVLGYMVNPIDMGNNTVLAESANIPSDDSSISAKNATIPESGVILSIDDPLPENNTIEKLVSNDGTHYISVNFSVGAKDVTSYEIYIQADSTTLTGTTYLDQIYSINSTDISSSSFGAKQWGYAVARGADANVDSLKYNPVQTSVTTPADTVTVPENGIIQDYTLAFAANLTTAIPDHYKSDIILSVAMMPSEIPLRTMQDFATNKLCASLKNEVRLIDDRTASGLDKRTYWVAKMPDDKCWMAQNLSLNLTSSTVLTTDDSDVSSSWSVGNTLGNSYKEPGDYIYKDASNTDWPIVSGLSGNPVFLPIEDDWTASAELPSGSAITSTYNASEKTYDAHYVVGNYYNYNTATAGTARDGGDSICPRGWKLPTQTEYNNLISGLNSTLIRQAPYYFIPAGCYDSKYINVGNNGTYWSSTPGMALLFHSGAQGMSNLSKSYGYQIRCVVK